MCVCVCAPKGVRLHVSMWKCVLSLFAFEHVFALVCMYNCMRVCTCYCLCASLAHSPAQGRGLILCGLERINFALTLAGCGLHPYPPLLSFPGASQRRRQASQDGENEGAQERGVGAGGSRESKKCHFRKGLYSLLLTVSPFLCAALSAVALQIHVFLIFECVSV